MGCDKCSVRIISKPPTKEYEEAYDRIFKKMYDLNEERKNLEGKMNALIVDIHA